jgi:hypothetical protein
MIVSISSCNVPLTEDIDHLACDALRNHLDTMAEEVLSVDVFLNNVDAAKQAVFRAHLCDSREITVETVEESVAVAIRRGSEQVREAVCESVTN